MLHGLRGEQPGESDLAGRRLLACGHALEELDDGPVRAARLRGEAGQRGPKVPGAIVSS
jgi:hypothetical protein